LVIGKLRDRRDPLSHHFVKAFDELEFDSEEITE
jgi:hypothetical protein